MQGLLTSASKHEGVYKYNFATVPFLAELLKLIISSVLLQRQKQTSPGMCINAIMLKRHGAVSVFLTTASAMIPLCA